MKKYQGSRDSVLQHYKSVSGNTVLFENCSTIEKFPDSRFGICKWTNKLIDEYLPTILQKATAIHVGNVESNKKYYQNPMALSVDVMGSPDYWYLILAMNSYNTRYDFKNFTSILLVPSTEVVDVIISKMEKENG